MQREREHWTVDKKVPIALIVGMLAQFAGFVWWASQLSSSVEVLRETNTRFEKRLDISTERIERGELARNASDMRIVRVEERLQAIYEVVKKIDGKLEQKN